MVLSYRCNVPERPRPAAIPGTYHAADGRFYRARILPFKRAKIQTSVESLEISPFVRPDQQED
jgi:hypothetical protein